MSTLALRITLKAAKRRCFKLIRFNSRGLSASLPVFTNMEKTFDFQDKLPSLPVPALDKTCKKYLDSVKPHLTEKEFIQTQFVVNEFVSGVGKELQEKLETRGKNMRNWLERWWEDVAYLASRTPSTPMINIGGPVSITDLWPVQGGTQIKRAALAAHAILLTSWQRIYRQLQEIQSIAKTNKPGPSIGSLTAEERNVWYELRERLISLDRNNKKHLDTIETSLFALVLDDTTPATDTETCSEAIAGDCRNRWFDKSLSILVFKSGRLGTHCDHAPFDGVVEINAIISACQYLKERGGEWKGSMEIKNFYKPQELVFTTDDVISNGIRQAIQKYEKAASLVNILMYRPEEYGKGLIKPFKIHPDTFVQMAIQLTYYKLHGKPVPTYETGQTRQFYHGRTETVRSCTVESTAWCKAMADNYADNSNRLRLFREACSKHDNLMKEAVNGHGIDRHLLGLQMIAASEGIPTPAIYLDKAWTASGGGANFVLSTSCAGFSYGIGGCAAMVTDGYGTFYSIEEDVMNFVIATFKNSKVTDGTKFQNTLGESLKDMRRLLLAAKL